jgi:hypothetical protein
MSKTLKILLTGLALLLFSAGFGIYSNAAYDSAQCISTFEGQNSLICKVGGSSVATSVLQVIFIIGLLLLVISVKRHYQKKNKL